jgi:hypothetical protein
LPAAWDWGIKRTDVERMSSEISNALNFIVVGPLECERVSQGAVPRE